MFQLQTTLPAQLPEVADCHLASFPDSFGTKLGPGYTKKSLEWFLVGDNRFLLHLTEGNKIIGYCGGFQSKGLGDGSTSGMMQYAMREAAIGMIRKPWLFFHKELIRFYPLITRNIFRRISGSKMRIATPSGDNHSVHIGLVVIGVLPEYRGKGCFEMLMRHFEDECVHRKAAKMILSVKASNQRAIAAYKRSGWLISLSTDKVIEMYKPL